MTSHLTRTAHAALLYGSLALSLSACSAPNESTKTKPNPTMDMDAITDMSPDQPEDMSVGADMTSGCA